MARVSEGSTSPVAISPFPQHRSHWYPAAWVGWPYWGSWPQYPPLEPSQSAHEESVSSSFFPAPSPPSHHSSLRRVGLRNRGWRMHLSAQCRRYHQIWSSFPLRHQRLQCPRLLSLSSPDYCQFQELLKRVVEALHMPLEEVQDSQHQPLDILSASVPANQ